MKFKKLLLLSPLLLAPVISTLSLVSCAKARVNSYDMAEFKNGNNILNYQLTFSDNFYESFPQGIHYVFLGPNNADTRILFGDGELMPLLGVSELLSKFNSPLILLLKDYVARDEGAVSIGIGNGWPDASLKNSNDIIKTGQTLQLPYSSTWLNNYNWLSSAAFYTINVEGKVSKITDYSPYKGLIHFTENKTKHDSPTITGNEYRSGMNLANAKIQFNQNFDWSTVTGVGGDNMYVLTGKIGGYMLSTKYPNNGIHNSIIITPSNSSIYFCNNNGVTENICINGEWQGIDVINFDNVYAMNHSIFMSITPAGGYDGWDVYEKQFNAYYDPTFDNLLNLFSKIELSSQPTNYNKNIITGIPGGDDGIDLSSVASKDYATLSQFFSGNSSSAYFDFDTSATFGAISSYDSSILMNPSTYYFNLPSSITTIGDNCFNSFTSLYGCNLLNTQHICSNCFNNCTNLFNASGFTNNGTVYFNNLLDIGDNCFCSTSVLNKLDFKNVSSIGDNCFKNCENLHTINFKNLAHLGEGCFDGCSNLRLIISNFDSDPEWSSAFGETLPESGIIVNLNPEYSSDEFKNYLEANVNETFETWTAV